MEKEKWKSYYNNGNIKEECEMKYGKLNGISTLYDEKGKIIEKRIYSNDMLMGNPFTGLSPEEIANKLGFFIVDPEEWDLIKKSNKDVIEIDEKVASLIYFNNLKK
ncbi:hypothetical protein ACO1GZ_02655 [Fusobacterium watanabei]|uniref:hypothetical protein n=1 Tax=Fusobacterium watanabei TaxID=2686067 RepID=UPI003B588FD1